MIFWKINFYFNKIKIPKIYLENSRILIIFTA